ncbi:MAG TPA: hypothetical protein VGD67_02580 [Pseudonocardiaceae bacterium]
MIGRMLLLVLTVAAVASCVAPEPPPPAPATDTPEQVDFGAPPSSDVLRRALRTDLCALLDESALTDAGLVRGTAQAETLTACAAGSPDRSSTLTLSLDTAPAQAESPADGDRCTRVRVVDGTTAIALKAQARHAGDPCALARAFVDTAAGLFEAGAGEVTPPHPWLALDACELLPGVLDAAREAIGGPRPTLRELRRLGARGCIATHERGEVTLSVAPASGRAADLDGEELAVAAHRARVREYGDTCVVRLVGDELGGGRATQVVTVDVTSRAIDAARRCAAATGLAEALVPLIQ